MAGLKRLLKRITGADRPPIIADIGITREDVEASVAHALTSQTSLPVHAWSVDPLPASVPGCDVCVSGAGARRIRRDLGHFWPALIIVSWRGERRALTTKLIPFLVPPFRFVVANEAGGFFAARPRALAEHAGRRLRDSFVSGARRLADWAGGARGLLWALLINSAKGVRHGADRLLSLCLAVLALVARATPGLVHRALRRLPAGNPAPALTVEPCGVRYREILVSGRTWMRSEVATAALDSETDFVVFRRLGEKADPSSLIELARETGAFVTAPQIAWSGWRRTVVPKHPFRQLQQGEVTQVMAPWSTLLVMRRDLLQQLRVPASVTFGGALLALYWKAAASGLQCLVAGQGRTLTQEPAMELEDAELVARLFLTPSLRALAAAHPRRVRGNVAHSPAHRKEFRGLPRVVVVSPYLPFPLSHGGAVRMYNLCRAMASGIDFILLCFREAGDKVHYDELHEVFRDVRVVDIDQKNPDETVPRQVAEYRHSAMAELVSDLCLSRTVDAVQLEYTQMAEYASHTGGVPVILVEHDLTFTLHEQLAKSRPDPAQQRQYELWHAFERAALQCSSVVWTMSDHDRTIALENGAPRKATHVIPNGVDLRRFQPVRRQTQERTVLFLGSFRHLPNLLAYEALRDGIMPEVWKSLPDVRLHVIAGPHHEVAARNAGKQKLLAPDPRIRIQGFVEDVRPAYRECSVAAIPLPVSAGTNIKLMEAMACGRAVVSTPVGCVGLDLQDEQDLLIRDLGPAFAEALVRLFRDEETRLRLAARGRQLAEERFGWDAIASVALESYRELLEQAPSTSAPRHFYAARS